MINIILNYVKRFFTPVCQHFKLTWLWGVSIIILLVLMYNDHLFSWIKDWFDFESFYSFGSFLIVYLIYFFKKNYKLIYETPNKHSFSGIIFLLIGSIFYIVGTRSEIVYLLSLSLPVIIAGLILLFYGKKVLHICLMPLFLFTLSLPIVPIFRILFPFQILISKISTVFLNILGINAKAIGNSIYLGNYTVCIESGCTGVNALTSLFLITTAYSYFIKSSFHKKTFIIAFSIPLAFIYNLLRVIILCLFIMYNGYNNFDNFHYFIGFFFMIVSVFTIILCLELIKEPFDEQK